MPRLINIYFLVIAGRGSAKIGVGTVEDTALLIARLFLSRFVCRKINTF